MEAIDLGRSFLLAAFREFHGEVLRCKRIVQANPWGVTGRDFLPGASDEADPPPAAALGRRLRALLERHARDAGLHRQDVDPKLFHEAQYVMAALADEVFLGLEWVGRGAWLGNLLEDQLFHTRRAGERIFEGVRQFRLRERDLARRELAAVYLLALSLGFEGPYRGTPGAPELEEHRRHLFEFVYLRPPHPRSGERRLFPQAYAHTTPMPAGPLTRHGTWVGAAAAFPPAWLAPAVPYLPVVLGVLALLVGGFFLVRRLRARRKAAAPPAPPPPSLKRLCQSFEAGVRALRGRVPATEARDRIPRFVVLGEAGAGKSSLLAGLRLRHVLPPAPPLVDAGALCRWWFFPQAVVLDLSGEEDAQVWPTFLRLVHGERPERGLDGIVLVVPCPELAGPARLANDALAARGETALRWLREAEHALRARLPVYLVVTRCDRLEGFQPLVDALAPAQREEIFGWSSPSLPEQPFEHAWIDTAFDTLEAELLEAGLELLAGSAPAAEAERILRLPGELRALAGPLRVYLGEAFRRSAYQRTPFLRGIYFTGDARADGVGEPAGAEAPSARHLAFLEHLFERKVFAEAASAAPAALPFPRGLREAEGRAQHLHTGSPR